MATTMRSWGLGWAIASVSVGLDFYSVPNRALAAASLVGLAGWGVGAAGTIHDLRRRFGSTFGTQLLCAIGWALGALVNVAIIATGLEHWNPGFVALIVGPAVGGAIGGAFTLPPATTPSSRLPAGPLRRAAESAVCWGTGFLVFSFVSFYAGYILGQMTIDPLVPILGPAMARTFGWALPAALGGYAAARIGVLSFPPPLLRS